MPKSPKSTPSPPNSSSQSSGDSSTSEQVKSHIGGQQERAPMAPHLGSKSNSDTKEEQITASSRESNKDQESQTADEGNALERRVRVDRIVEPSALNRRRPRGSLEDLSGSASGAIAFFVFAFLGMIFIVLAKMNRIDTTWDYGRPIVTVVPLVVMFTYAIAMVSIRSLRLRDDQAGDNLYYLGFLFTLTSIGVSLYQFTGAASADEIVSNFGIAVTSTIAGLMLRIVLNQTRVDPAQIERISRQDLAEASRKLRNELDIITREMSALGRTTQQKTKDILDVQWELVSEVKKLLAKSSSISDGSDMSEPIKRVHDQLDAIHQSVKNNRDSFGEVVRGAAGDVSTKFSTSTGTLLAELEKQGHHAAEGNRTINAALDNIGTSIDRSLKSQEETIGKLSALLEIIEFSNQQFGRFGRSGVPKKRGLLSRMFKRRNV